MNVSMAGSSSARTSDRRWSLIVVVAGASIALGGCGAVIPRVTPELVTLAQRYDPTIDTVRMEQTRELYVTRCSSCHSLNDPRAYSAAEWPDWMRKMARKAKLKDGQERALLTFVLAARDLPLPP